MYAIAWMLTGIVLGWVDYHLDKGSDALIDDAIAKHGLPPTARIAVDAVSVIMTVTIGPVLIPISFVVRFTNYLLKGRK